MVKVFKKFVCLSLFLVFSLSDVFSLQGNPSAISIAALTWNIGNQTARDDIVKDFAGEIKNHGFPDVIIVGTQEELAKNGEELKDRLARQLSGYRIEAQEAYTTLAGANNSAKTLGYAVVQNTVLPKALGLPQNRCALAILVKKDVALTGVSKRIDYPPGEKKSNNAFIVIEGTVTKGAQTLPVSIASVHLNSRSDPIRRSHASYFFDNQKFTGTHKKYDDILKEAKRFHLVMGDFNERDYLMKDSTVMDRGRLTNFTGYGYDFSEKQGRKSVVYGTYGYVKGGTTPDPAGDSRGRKHNAKGGFLDRIAITSGLPVESDGSQYGALITKGFDEKKNKKNKTFYAGSDHLPVIRTFTVTLPDNDGGGDEKIVKDYIKRRFPDFEQEIGDIGYLVDGKATEEIKARAKRLMFYDDPETPDKFLEKFSVADHSKSGLVDNLTDKKAALENLQKEVKNLKSRVNSSHNHDFLSAVYNKITDCNKGRNLSLEKMDDEKTPVAWYFPNSLGLDSFRQYEETLESLLKGSSGAPARIKSETSKNSPQKKKGFSQKRIVKTLKEKLLKKGFSVY